MRPSIYKFGDEESDIIEYIAANSYDDAKTVMLEIWEEEDIPLVAQILEEEDLERLKHSGLDGQGPVMTFKERLDLDIEEGVHFPCQFACNDVG